MTLSHNVGGRVKVGQKGVMVGRISQRILANRMSVGGPPKESVFILVLISLWDKKY